MDLTGAFLGRNGPSGERPPQLAILEHRRDLEKCLVVGRLRGQVFVYFEGGFFVLLRVGVMQGTVLPGCFYSLCRYGSCC